MIRLVAGNWKMNGSLAANRSLLDTLCVPAGVEMAVCVPFPYLGQLQERPAGLMLGAQDVSEYEAGAYTGEVSAAMLAEFGCRYVIVGHSERRALFAEDDVLVGRKARAALARGLVPIVCVGETLVERTLFDSPQIVRDWLRLRLGHLPHETFCVLLLDARHCLIDAVDLFRGTLTQTSVYPREVVKLCLARNAAAVIFAHNHPSGAAEPSTADELLTRALKEALSLVDVRVLDHFVVPAHGSPVSFAERGLL